MRGVSLGGSVQAAQRQRPNRRGQTGGAQQRGQTGGAQRRAVDIGSALRPFSPSPRIRGRLFPEVRPVVPLLHPRVPQNPHLAALLARFGQIRVLPGAVPPSTIIALCYTNRSGSSFIADLLASTGALNRALEMLNAEHLLALAEAGGHADFAAAFAAMLRAGQVQGRFALKLALSHLEILGEAGLLDQLQGTMRWVHITRADRLAQAISYVRALQTGRWTADQPGNGAAPGYAREAITVAIDDLADADRQLQRFFGYNGIAPAPISYERLVAAPQEEIAGLGAAIGLPGLRVDPARVTLARQADAVNASWRARYLAGE